MSGLRSDQFIINLDTIYRLDKFSDDFKGISPNIFIKGTGVANVYTSEEEPASKSEMQLEHEKVSGHLSLIINPNYIYVEQSTATVDKVVLSGVKPTTI